MCNSSLRLLVLSVVLSPFLLFAAAGTGFAHPGHYGSPFHAHHLEQALEYAGQEYRIVFLHVSEANGKRLRFFRWPSDANADLIDLLVRETVIVELDAAANAEELAALNIEAPEILLMNPDGSVIQRIDASLPVPALAAKLNKALTGEDAVERARANLATKGEDDFFSQERLATALSNAGDTEEAVGIYRWCAEKCIANASLAAVGRRPKVFAAMAEFAQTDDQAKIMLDDVLDNAEATLISNPNDATLPKDLVQIYKRGNESRANEFFNQLPQDSIARHGLLDYLFDDLIQQGRYKEVIKLIDPAESFKGEVAKYQRNRILRPAQAENGQGRGTRAFVIQRSSGLVQALAATDNREKAKALIKEVIEFDEKPATRKALIQGLDELGKKDLLQEN